MAIAVQPSGMKTYAPRRMNSDLPRHLADLGFETKTIEYGGQAQRVVVSPTGSAFDLEATFAGDLPSDPMLRDWTLKRRWTATPAYGAAFWKWIAAVGKTRNEQVAHLLLDPDEGKALAAGIDSTGGTLVPPDFSATILGRLSENNLAFQLAEVRPCNRDALAVPRVQPSTSNPSIFSGGFEVSPVGETPTQSDFDPSFGQFHIGIRKFRARTRVSNNLLSDASWMVDALGTLAARDLGALMTREFLVGPGDSLNWLGVVNAPNVTALDVTGSSAHSLSNTTANPGSATKLRLLRDALPPQYWQNARWLFSGSIRQSIEALVAGVGQPILSMYRQQDEFYLDVHPYSVSNWMPPDGAAGTVMAFGDFKHGYVVGQRSDLAIRIDSETCADTDQCQLVLFARSGEAVVNPDAIRLGTLS